MAVFNKPFQQNNNTPSLTNRLQQAGFYGTAANGARLTDLILGQEGLGRLSNDPQLQAVIQQKRKLAQGLTGTEMQGARDIASQSISGANQTSMRALRALQASSGVKGATATGQQSRLLQQGAEQKGNFERDLMLRNYDAQVKGTDSLENSLNQNARFDIGQAAAEKQMQATGIFGGMQLPVQDWNSAIGESPEQRAARKLREAEEYRIKMEQERRNAEALRYGGGAAGSGTGGAGNSAGGSSGGSSGGGNASGGQSV